MQGEYSLPLKTSISRKEIVPALGILIRETEVAQQSLTLVKPTPIAYANHKQKDLILSIYFQVT